METQDEGATVEASIADLRGVAVPPLLDARLASLMWSFAQLTPHGQKRFMELLNDYLYASPAQRRQMRGDWEVALAEACACGLEQEQVLLQARRKA
ncbi:hypothetical protein I5U23_16420 [Stenotrophomonas maltophilia]|uniref:Uncharacterized protein n=1 Tax=Stenotrophomonas riyadhensis TaxID=2859893 RepID=A0ABT2XDJ3_9GAMM|nr:hypothetical protein [Stenotrophomonas sp. CFS3442]MBH1619506.1 hypothetical protein [Stenotrophomonas maltophilia]MCV0323736.1 hypothetical protein [Stenotrophomonas sp. CFS3442]HEL4244665.1 hypothetical protein [Stenotrophomonas maltophilia]